MLSVSVDAIGEDIAIQKRNFLVKNNSPDYELYIGDLVVVLSRNQVERLVSAIAEATEEATIYQC